MPTINEHFKLSLKRTGKEYRELHEWIEGFHSTKKEKEDKIGRASCRERV